MSVALPGARFLFSILQSLLVDQPSSKRLRLPPLVHAALQDWQHLADSITSNPLPIASLVPQAPSYMGAVDASGYGQPQLAPAMLNHGHFTIIQNQQIPQPRLPPVTGGNRGL